MGQLCLIDVGNIRGRFLQSKSWDRIQKKYKGIAFYDNNQDFPENIADVRRIKNIDNGMEVLIIGDCFWEIYHECVLNKKVVIGIWDSEVDAICDYKTMCKKKRIGYENDAMIAYSEEVKLIREKNLQSYLKTKDLYHNISEIAIMLSNLCNYAMLHLQCPANHIKRKEIMPGSKVYQIMDELAENEYEGSICFHIYNEPTIDPRLFMFIQYAKKKMPNCKVRIYSNGYYLNRMMLEEFHDVGADVFNMTGYGTEEYERLIDIDVNYPFDVIWGHLDERMDWYREENIGQKLLDSRCYTFLDQVCIYSNGEIGTCCLDYKTPYKLGNIFTASLKEILDSKELLAFQDELINGNRCRFSLCSNCHWKR